MNLISLSRSELIEFAKKLLAENLELKAGRDTYGVGADLLRSPDNFRPLDEALETFAGRPFSLTDLFDVWNDMTKVAEDQPTKVIENLKKHVRDLLVKNGIIYKSGSQGRNNLYRIVQSYNYVLLTATELTWRKAGQDEGTYLIVNQS
jgi:hypothetical protein